jgi:hypothetical protein
VRRLFEISLGNGKFLSPVFMVIGLFDYHRNDVEIFWNFHVGMKIKKSKKLKRKILVENLILSSRKFLFVYIKGKT